MFSFLKRFFGFFSPEKDEIDPDEIIEEQWTADFGAKESRFRFTITAENAYRAYLRKLQSAGDEKEKPVLALGLLKTGCIAWTEDNLYRYRDLVIRGSIRLDPAGGYGAAGFMFRIVDENTYYMALVSNRGYFRLDLVRNRTPLALTGWTEAPGLKHTGVEESLPVEFVLEVIAYGARILVLVNDEWAAEINDPSLSEGRIAFCAASYDGPEQAAPARFSGRPGVEALLSAFCLDSRIGKVSVRYDEAAGTARPENRIRLAETFAALGRANPALVQIRKAWESRIEAGTDPARPSGELLLGARLALAMELWDEAEDCIEAGLSAGDEAGEFRSLKAGLLYSRSAYRELLSWAEETSGLPSADSAAFYNLLGHAFFHLENYEEAAKAYDRACAEEGGKGKNGLTAKNAAGAWELLGDGRKALDRYIRAGRIFLDQNQYEELGLLVPKLRLFGPADWEARALIGKWAFGIENWAEAEAELETAEELRKAPEIPPAESGTAEHGPPVKPGPKPPPDPAVFYLKALLFIRKNRRREALSLLEKAAKYAPDYPLFRFRLAENRFLLLEQSGVNPAAAAEDPALRADIEAALAVSRDEGESYGWVHNFAAQLDLSRGNLAGAGDHLEKAASVLGEIPAVLVNRAVAFYLGGKLDEALALLKSGEDPEGLMANCAGNLLVRAGCFEEADPFYKKAIAAAPQNQQYHFNRASCLVELARYGEADAVLTGFSGAPSPEILELIAFVAAKKGEYRRAETASRAALEINPEYAPSLLHLGWSRAAGGRWEEVKEILERLDDLELNEEMSGGRDDLAARMEEATTRFVACASCGTEWRVRKNPDPVPPIRLYAMPPDDMPAGICPACGKSYCVGCRKDALDEAGRFTCPECGKTLKLSDEGVKELVYIWAEENIAREKKKQKKKSKPAGELSVPVTEPEVPKNSVSPSAEPSVSGPMDGEQTSAEPEHGGQVVAGTAPGGEAAGPEVVPPQPESVALPAAGPLPVAENNTPLSTEASASGPENGEVTGQPAL